MADAVHTTRASRVMRRAWEIFRTTYSYPRIPFRSIGRKCFASALRRAWAEYRAAADLAATATETLLSRVRNIDEQLEGLKFAPWGRNASAEGHSLRQQLSRLQREISRRKAPSEPLSLAA